jgi:hypothetical protein
MFINDRQITISAGSSRRSTVWHPQTMLLSELYERLRTPARGKETFAEYMAMKKAQQDDLKDVGGFVAGSLQGSRRKAGAVAGRDVLTLDLDNTPPAARTTSCGAWAASAAGTAYTPPASITPVRRDSASSCRWTGPSPRTSTSHAPGRWPNT